MVINSVRFFRYDLPLRKPLLIGHEILQKRSGLLLCLVSDDGSRGWGDAAPLPGFSAERFSGILEEARRLVRTLCNKPVPDDLAPLGDGFGRWLQHTSLSCSMTAALETAVLDLQARVQGTSLRRKLNPEAADSIAINGLLNPEKDLAGLWQAAEEMAREGIKTIKAKVGRHGVEHDVQMVRGLREVLGEGVGLRLDANRAWGWEEALAFGRAVADLGVEYLEEPLEDPSRLIHYRASCGVPIALDETAVEQGPTNLEWWRGADAIVLKPTLLGGLERTLWLARRGVNIGMRPVISSAFESGIGIRAWANLAASLTNPAPCGLDTYRALAKDVLPERIDMGGGSVDLKRLDALAEAFDGAGLEEIARA
jgi:O-succinylbenzoate synthase